MSLNLDADIKYLNEKLEDQALYIKDLERKNEKLSSDLEELTTKMEKVNDRVMDLFNLM